MSSTSVLISSESLSTDSLACWPASVSGLPRPSRSSTNVLVALFMSPIALLTESSERLPPFRESAAEVIESFHVVKLEQRLSAQSAVAVVPLLLPVLPPQPAATSARASTGMTSRQRLIGPPYASRRRRARSPERDDLVHALEPLGPVRDEQHGAV